MNHDSHSTNAHGDSHDELMPHDASDNHNMPEHLGHVDHANHGTGLGFIKEKKMVLAHPAPNAAHNHDSSTEKSHTNPDAERSLEPSPQPTKSVFKLHDAAKHYVAMCMSCGRQSIYEMKNESKCCNIISNLKFMRVFNDSEEAKNFIKYQEV
jgi:hypothetical protein